MHLPRALLLSALVYIAALVGTPPCAAQTGDLGFSQLPQTVRDFIYREQVLNNHFDVVKTGSTVSDSFRPGAQKPFTIKYVEIPVEDLHVVDSQLGPASVREQILIEHEGKKYFRFFIHPDSEELYEPLLKRYSRKGNFAGVATASTRTVLLWDPKNPRGPPFFAKLSLDKMQFGLGRAIPDWEVRKSVAMTSQMSKTPAATWQKNGVTVVPEFLGAYVDERLGLSSFVDMKQGAVLQHGLIFRDADFLLNGKKGDIYPAFSLFAEGPDRAPPLIVKWWKESGSPWREFIRDSFIDPVVKGSAYLTMTEGYTPEMHGQNILVRVDPETKKVTEVIHRDIGSMKADLRLRWANGLGASELRSKSPMKDFKFLRATELHGTPYFGWFHSYLFTDFRGQEQILAKHIPGYDASEMKVLVDETLQKEATARFAGPRPVTKSEMGDYAKWAERHLQKSMPVIKPEDLSARELKNVKNFVEVQTRKKMTIRLEGWKLPSTFVYGQAAVTEYGVVTRYADGTAMLSLYTDLADAEAVRAGKFALKVPIEDLRAGQLVIGGEKTLSAAAETLAQERPYFPVIRSGSETAPVYTLLDGHNRAVLLHRKGDTELLVDVVEDLTGLPASKQKEVLQARGYYWSPENPEGAYREVRLADLPESSLRDEYLLAKERKDPAFRKFTQHNSRFKELIFARKQWEKKQYSVWHRGCDSVRALIRSAIPLTQH